MKQTMPRHKSPTKTALESGHDPPGFILCTPIAPFQTNEPSFPQTILGICILSKSVRTPPTTIAISPRIYAVLPRVHSEDRHSDATQWLGLFVPAADFRRVMVVLKGREEGGGRRGW